jgi:hypothetical protein
VPLLRVARARFASSGSGGEAQRLTCRAAPTPQVFTQKDGGAGGEADSGQKFTQAKDLLKARRGRRGARPARRKATARARKPWLTRRTATQVYGSAYLITSISLSVVSFSLSYVLVSAGVDVAGLLEKARAAFLRAVAPPVPGPAADAPRPARRSASP